jgi:hypothetical protein
MEALLNTKQAAAILGVCARQLRYLTTDGIIPFVNVGLGVRPSFRYRIADLDAFISQRVTTCQKAVGSFNAQGQKPGASILELEVIDFAAQREQRTAAKLSAGLKNSRRRKAAN